MGTYLIDEELELDDSSTTFMLTVALHACTAKPKSWLSQGKTRNSLQKVKQGPGRMDLEYTKRRFKRGVS